MNRLENEFGFIISTYCINEIHFRQLIRCIKSIRNYYLSNKIIIIDDYSNYDLENYFEDLALNLNLLYCICIDIVNRTEFAVTKKQLA